jgi:hypothetical protein
MAASRQEDPFIGVIRLVLGVARRARRRVAVIGGFALPFHGVSRSTGDVDFLADAQLGDRLDAALVDAGARRLHRSDDAANYAAGGRLPGGVDFIFAHRPRAMAMLERAKLHRLKQGGLSVPVVDAESLIGLKLQALANDPTRRQDEADIEALLATVPSLDVPRLRDYFRLFERQGDLDRLLAKIRRR